MVSEFKSLPRSHVLKIMEKFIQSNFPHINLDEAMPRSDKEVLPLCDLGILFNSCQDSTIVEGSDGYYWKKPITKESCLTCSIHSERCEREH